MSYLRHPGLPSARHLSWLSPVYRVFPPQYYLIHKMKAPKSIAPLVLLILFNCIRVASLFIILCVGTSR